MQSAENPAKPSVIDSELKKQFNHEVCMEVEFCLTTGLGEFDDLSKTMKESSSGIVPFEKLLDLGKLKDMDLTRDDLLTALAASEKLEISSDGVRVKRRPLGELEDNRRPEDAKKLKTEKGEAKASGAKEIHTEVKEAMDGSVDPKIYKVTFTDVPKNLRDSRFEVALHDQLGVDILFAKIYHKEGYFAVDPEVISEDDRKRLAKTHVTISDVMAKVEEIWDEDLDNYMKKYGKHLTHHLERSGRRHKKAAGTKDEVELVFYCKKYTDLAPLEYLFSGILSKLRDKEHANAGDSALLREFLYYHHDSTLSEEVTDFVCGFHPDDPSKKCFFAIKSGGEKVPFTFDDCSENLLEQVILPKVEAAKEKENEAKGEDSKVTSVL